MTSYSASALPAKRAACGAATGAAAGAAAAATGAETGAGAAAAASAPSSTRITEPSATLSPTLTLSSLTTPALLDGISIDALSLSTVMRLCSTLTVSPAFTSTSITPTSAKSPMSGTFTSIVAMSSVLSKSDAAEVRQQLSEVDVEARGRGAVDDAVVPAQGQRQRQARHELLAVPDGLGVALAHAHDRDFRRVDDRREVGAADASERRDAEAAAAHVRRVE